MAGKALSFGFAKKTEPKRVVAALAQKKDDGRVAITGLEEGKLRVNEEQEAAKKLSIPCKNPLDERAAPAAPKAPGTVLPVGRIDEQKGGLQTVSKLKLSAEDEEALQELRKDLASGGDGEPSAPVAPILMRAGSKRVREGREAPEATKDMFEKVPVESFGEALLRGMGFDPTKHTTKPVFHDKPRDSNLGLGAKALLPSERKAPPKKPGSASSSGGGPSQTVVKAPSTSEVPAERAEEQVQRPLKQQRIDGQAVDVANAVQLSRDSSASGAGTQGAKTTDMWPSRGLVVRVSSGEKHLRQFNKAEAVVLEVNVQAGSCRVKARVGDKSHVLEGVSPHDLEPVVTAECVSVRLLRGEHKGLEASLLHRSERRAIARVKLDSQELELPLRDVCEFIARRR